MDVHLTPWQPGTPALNVQHEAEMLHGILAYNTQLTAAQRARLVHTVLAAPSGALFPSTAAGTAVSIMLRPGVVQAAALGLNYAIVLGLDMSGTLQYSDVPAQALLLGVNYLVLTSLMMSLSLLCLIHSFVRVNLRPAYRALLVAMGATGAFGMMESLAFNTSSEYTPLMLLLFVVTVPLASLFVALYSVAQGVAQSRRQLLPVQVPIHDFDATRLPPHF